MSKLPLRFTLVLLACLSTAFAFHILVLLGLEMPMLDDKIMLSYLVNFLLAFGIFLGLYTAREKLGNSLGFLFMGGSLLKFLVFFLLFYPSYKADGKMESSEFAAFFVPYLIALILETVFASRMLRQMEQKTD